MTLAIGVVFFLAWDAAGILTGVFVQGDSPLYTGVVLAPHLPLEEIFFLAFLCYVALVCGRGVQHMLARRTPRATTAPPPSRPATAHVEDDRG